MYFKAGICSILKSIIRVLSHKSFLTFFCVVCIAYFNHRNYQSGHHIQKQCKTNTVSIRRIIHAKKNLDFILISELDNHETMYILSTEKLICIRMCFLYVLHVIYDDVFFCSKRSYHQPISSIGTFCRLSISGFTPSAHHS